MTSLTRAVSNWGRELWDGWNRFWFDPEQPHTLAAIRWCGGSMIFYTHLVWAKELTGFFGPDGWLPRQVSWEMHQLRGSWAWSHLWLFDSPTLLWIAHLLALVVFACFAVGLFTRITSVLTFLLVVSYCHRMEGALFGLDQVNAMLAMYLMLSACGDVYSLDAWWKRRRGRGGEAVPRVSNRVAVRLIQLHMCVIYLFGGIGKMRGELWWDGYAMWFAAANLEYQSLDLTWILRYPALMALLTHVTVFWETFYCFLVWPRLTRPIALFLAVVVHLGIALHLGMITFGLAMIIGNAAFIPPDMTRRTLAACGRLVPGRSTG